MRTIFSSGVCDALLEGGLLPDYVIGVSAGIAYGVSYVSGQPRRNLKILTQDNQSYFGLEFTYETIPNELIPFDSEAFAAYPGEIEAVVTNLETGEAEYFPVPRRDDKFIVLQATCALPLLFPVFDLDGKLCMDGGVADSIPYKRAFEMGCDRVVVVLTKTRSYIRKKEKLMPVLRRKYKQYPKFLACMENRSE